MLISREIHQNEMEKTGKITPRDEEVTKESTKGPICVSYTVFHGPVTGSRSIVRENTQPKETRRWHIIREGRKEGVPRYSE